jgi:hypothetical protein
MKKRNKLFFKIHIVIIEKIKTIMSVCHSLCFREVRKQSNTINSKILCKQPNIFIDVSLYCYSHIVKYEFMYSYDSFMSFGWQNWIKCLLKSFRKDYFLTNIRRWILFDCLLYFLNPIVYISPFSVV